MIFQPTVQCRACASRNSRASAKKNGNPRIRGKLGHDKDWQGVRKNLFGQYVICRFEHLRGAGAVNGHSTFPGIEEVSLKVHQ